MAGDYLPIEDHAAIGNLRTIALVGRDGAIDWCPFPELPSASVFASILDHRRGGRFRVHPRGAEHGTQTYLRHTNVLESRFDVDGAQMTTVDCMPLRGDLNGVGGSTAQAAIHRLVRAEGGDIEVEVEWSPRFQYGNGAPQILAVDDGFLAWAGDQALTLSGVNPDEATITEDDGAATLRATIVLPEGRQRALITAWGADVVAASPQESQRVITAAVEAWRAWIRTAESTGPRTWADPHQEVIVRAELALKLLTNGDTGAIAGAATTSLPEDIGGVRNWDYRYSWIRDAALTAQALLALGHSADAHAYVNWVERTARRHRAEDGRVIRVVYGLCGETELEEQEHPNLEGYRRSAPVRTGNGAAHQLQLDIFGELISVVYEMVRFGEDLSEDLLEFLPSVADDACRHWRDRDDGLWELRNGPFHFVYSKVMVWMGLDRAIALADAGVIGGDTRLWNETREQIHEEVLQQGFDADLSAFRQSYERSVLDASNLLFPLLEFLPFDDPRVDANLRATVDGLSDRGLIRRYLASDGIAGEEGAFGLANFWLIDALAMSGRAEAARARFERMIARANHVGLYSEEIDPASGAFLGNFPQAFTHVGVITSALYLAYADGREAPVSAPIGSHEHRQRRPDGT